LTPDSGSPRVPALSGTPDPEPGTGRVATLNAVAGPRWLEPDEQAAWRGFLQSYAVLTAYLGRELSKDTGLSMQDYAVLVELSESADGRMRAFELGRRLVWEKSRLSHHVARMQQRGLVERVKCASDQRGSFVAITAQGRKAIERAAPRHAEAVREYFVDVLSPQELRTLRKVAEKIDTKLEGECDASGDC
jgi:DNA-binding MarR family transcriptional regulator